MGNPDPQDIRKVNEAERFNLLVIINQMADLPWIPIRTSYFAEANRQRTFVAAIKDLDFWLGEVESLLNTDDHGKDLASVQNLMKKHQVRKEHLKNCLFFSLNLQFYLANISMYVGSPNEHLTLIGQVQIRVVLNCNNFSNNYSR